MHRSFAFLLLPAALLSSAAHAADGWAVNAFRNPSIGLEYRHGAVSVHSGYYTTILRDPGAARSEATGFVRTGVTLWLGERWYGSLSHLRALDGARDGRDFAIAEAGVQFTPWQDVHLRLGVAVIPAAHGFARKVNPTPGISLGFTL